MTRAGRSSRGQAAVEACVMAGLLLAALVVGRLGVAAGLSQALERRLVAITSAVGAELP